VNYIAVTIDGGGYIRTNNPFGNIMIHRETLNIHVDHVCSPAQGDLRYKCRTIPAGKVGTGIAQLRDDGGVDTLWVPESQESVWRDKLKIWKGCYGAWPVQTYKEGA